MNFLLASSRINCIDNTINDAVKWDIDKKRNISINIFENKTDIETKVDCYMEFSIDRPRSFTLSFTNKSEEIFIDEIDKFFFLEKRMFNGMKVIKPFKKHAKTVQYNISSGRYYIHIDRIRSNFKEIDVNVLNLLSKIENLNDLNNSSNLFTIDPLSGLFYYTIDVSSRSLVELSLTIPKSWQNKKIRNYKWAMTYFDSLQINIVNNKKTIQPYYRYDNLDSSKKVFAFLLNKGSYVIRCMSKLNHWPRTPLDENITQNPLNLKVSKKQKIEKIEKLHLFEKWLKDSGLSNYFEIHDLYTVGTKTSIPDIIKKKLLERLDFVHNERKLLQKRYPEKDIFIGTKPKTIVTFRNKVGRHKISKFEKKFYRQYGVTFWNKVFRKLSYTLGIKSKDIVLYIPIYCSGRYVYEHVIGYPNRYGDECMSAVNKIKLENINEEYFTKASRRKIQNEIDFKSVIPRFLSSYFTKDSIKIDYLAKSKSFVEVIIRGLKGEVLPSSTLWEKLQLVFIKSGMHPNDLELIVMADGQLSAGIGEYPPDTQFTRDMEPEYSESLTNYAKKISTSINDFIRE